MKAEHGVVRGLSDLRRHARELDELATATAAPASSYSASILGHLEPHPGLDPVLVTVRREGRLRAAAALALRQGRLGPQIVKAGVPGEPFRLLALEPGDADVLARAMVDSFGHLDRGWRLHLTDLPASDRTVDGLLRAAPHGRRHLTTPTPTLWVGPGSQLPTLISRNTRNARNKAVNRIRRDGRELTLRWLSEPGPIEAELPAVIDLHIRRNAQMRSEALLDLESERDTFTQTLMAHAHQGRVRLLEACIDGQVAAFAACLVTGRRLWAYSNYAHPDWLDYSPGTIANAEVIRAAHDDADIDVMDWGSGVQRYKLSGGAVLVDNQELYAWRHRHMAVLWSARNRRRSRINRRREVPDGLGRDARR